MIYFEIFGWNDEVCVQSSLRAPENVHNCDQVHILVNNQTICVEWKYRNVSSQLALPSLPSPLTRTGLLLLD